MFGQVLKGKTAVITGSTQGIGLSIARAFANAGANIVFNGYGPDAQIKKTETELSSANQKAKYIFADMTKGADCRSLIEKSIAHFGQVDILVNNAGMSRINNLESYPQDIWEKTIALNLSATFYTTRYALSGMKQRGWGRIINMGSVHGLVASANKSCYSASKHAVVGFTKAVALQAAKTGVTVNVICPGFILTQLVQDQTSIMAKQRNVSNEQMGRIILAEKQPSGEFVTAEDIGVIATFLCTHNARQITGASYTLDGGWTAQ